MSTRIGIDACSGGCIRFRENRVRRIGRDGSGNSWFRRRNKIVGISAVVKIVVVVVGTDTGSTGVE